MSFTPSLACHIGVNEAIAVQTISFLVSMPNSGEEIDGEWYVYNSLDQWQKNWFPFWNKRTIQRVFKSLTDAGILITRSPLGLGTVNRYRINHGAYETLLLENSPEPDSGEDYGQIVQGGMDRLSTAYKTESTTESTKGCGISIPHSGSGFKKGPRYPYPTTEEELIAGLEEDDIEHNPDRDGDFLNQMIARNWTIRGERVWDWKAAYRARVENAENACKRR